MLKLKFMNFACMSKPENREMSLSDGTFLVSPARYDYLVKVLWAMMPLTSPADVTCVKKPLSRESIIWCCAVCRASQQSGQTVEELTARGLKRVSPSFRVIALGLPVPEYPGYPIDPPLRSRFQGRYISAAPMSFHHDEVTRRMQAAAGGGPEGGGVVASPLTTTSNLLTFLRALSVLQHSGTIDSGGGLLDSPKVLPIPEMIADNVKRFLSLFPEEQNSAVILKRLYPFHLFSLDNAQQAALESMLESFNGPVLASGVALESSSVDEAVGAGPQRASSPSYCFTGVNAHHTGGEEVAEVVFSTSGGSAVTVSAVGGRHITSSSLSESPSTGVYAKSEGTRLVGTQLDVLTGMMQSHCLGHDICLVGEYVESSRPYYLAFAFVFAFLPVDMFSLVVTILFTGEKGCGKSVLVDYFAEKLQYGTPEMICCYKDMTSRDLLQRRRTDDAGNTRWQMSPLAAAALEGKLAVLDGVNRLTSDALSVISSLVKDR